MQQQITYCKSWFRARKQPTEIWPEEYARSAHRNKKLYSVVVGPVDRPFCFLEINKGFVGVGFLDLLAREYLYYAFREIKDGALFLSMTTYREYGGDTDKVDNGTTYRFQENGTVEIDKQSFNPITNKNARSFYDVAKNYDNWPEFGDYDHLIKIERS